ncbi:MFS transporter [Saccharopolyspora erythraea]|uniref:MFS transporter n=1 Tax=Saccharopolyspora erythraea TaxID=1836 RepID=UPI0020113AF0|nr:MFS transporter [Saccharopolyspora erythraea]
MTTRCPDAEEQNPAIAPIESPTLPGSEPPVPPGPAVPSVRPRTARRWLVLAVLCTSLLLTGLDLTVLHVAAPSLARDLSPSAPALLWIVDVYSLAVAALLVTCGTLADRVGRRRVVIAGFAVFGLASLAAAFADSTPQLIAARAVLGAGTALIMAATVAIIRNVFDDPRERTIAIGLWTAAHSVGTTLGPLVGGVLVENFHWGSVFLVNVPIVAVVLVVGVRVIPESRDPVPRRWDLPSALLSMSGLGGLVYGLKQIADPSGLTPASAGIGLAGLALLVWFGVRQRRLRHPLLDLGLFRERRFSAGALAIFGCFGTYVATLFLLTQWLQQAGGHSPLQAGAAVVPLAAANALGAALAPWGSNRLGYRRAMAAALVAFASALVVFAVAGQAAGYPLIAAMLVVAGFGAGVVMTAGSDLTTGTVSPHRAGEAAAVQETSFELSAGVTVAVLGSVLAISYRFAVPPLPYLGSADAASVGESIGAVPDVRRHLRPEDAVDLQALTAEAFDHAVRVACAAGAVVLLVTAIATAVLLRNSRTSG